MTKGDNINLYSALSDKKLGSLQGAKFAYAISRNLSLLQPEIDALKKALEASDEFQKYDEARVELAKSHAKKNDKGEPETTKNAQGQETFVLENQEAFDKAFEALKEEHKATLEARQKQVDEQNELLKTESTVTLYKVSLADVPNAITADQMKAISEIVEDAILSPFNK